MILITGGAGYIGSHCALYFIEKGLDEIVIFDNLSTGHIEMIETLRKINPKLEFFKGDLKNKSDIDKLFKKYKIDFVIHIAGLSQVAQSIQNPKIYWENNVLATTNLLNTMVDNSVLKMIFSSSASVYGLPKYTPIDENHPLNPVNSYGKTKQAIENMLDDYGIAYGLKSIKLRYFNVIGADKKLRIGEWHDSETHLVPNIIKSALSNLSEFKIFGDDYPTKDGSAIRDYIDVQDIADAHYRAHLYLSENEKSNVFNLASGRGLSVKEVYQITQKVVNKKIAYSISTKRGNEPAVLIADNKKANEVLKWAPQNTPENSIKNAYFWQKQLEEKTNAEKFA